MKTTYRLLAGILSLCVLLSLSSPVLATQTHTDQLENAVEKTASYVLKTVTQPQASSIGGAWAVLGLARSPHPVSQAYYQIYVDNLSKVLEEKGGILHERKYTDYSLHALALTSIGVDPGRVAGHDLLKPLSDVNKTVWQGINGPIWALIALDATGCDNPAARKDLCASYVDFILKRELPEGGFSLTGQGRADADLTGMALTALADHRQDPEVKRVTERAVNALASLQQANGHFASFGTSNAESLVQTIVGLTELGLSLDDARFVKNGRSLIDLLLDYQNPDGSFRHTLEASRADLMTTEQALYGLVAALRSQTQKHRLFDMQDVSIRPADKETDKTKNRHEDVRALAVIRPEPFFEDMNNHSEKESVLALASRGIVEGVGEDLFQPDQTMKRSEFATILTRALGLVPQKNNIFSDVDPYSWYAGYVGTAYDYGLVKGMSKDTFAPDKTLSREQAVTMVVRAARLCGLSVEMGPIQTRDVLAVFSDYTTVQDYAKSALAYAYQRRILDDDVLTIEPDRPVTRAQVASMLHRLLKQADLLE